jgi:kinesin family member 18/19
MIVRGNEYRTMSPTEANATSSRSHAVLQINVATKDRNADVNEPHTMATLSIIDLAGSERASATKNRGERLIEGANINKSLLALGSCINALCDPRKRNHVPYRNSKLTRLLKFSLGGNCRTVMIVCVSPSSAHFDETQNTLRYANRAKNIQTKVTKNVYNVNRHVKDYLKKIDEQRLLIEELKQAQKDYEGSAFIKFKKQSEKRECIAKEGIIRLRSAYDFSSAERQERVSIMKKLRQVERRISLISAWIAGFDMVCETREGEEPPPGLVAMRKTAIGIQAELEASRSHHHSKLTKNNWERALETALQVGLRQLKEADGVDDGSDVASLMREAELLKSLADREAQTAVLDQERGGDAAIVQVLLQAHFETIAIISQIMTMDEVEAVRAARNILGKIIASCSNATSQVIKPEGGLPVTEMFPPTKAGTPKARRAVHLMGPSPAKYMVKAQQLENISLSSSPTKGTPRRRKFGVRVTPKKKSPVKIKRSVRWKDDSEEGGTLVEFQPTPQHNSSATPTDSSLDLPPKLSIPGPTLSPNSSEKSSPIPSPPEPSIDIKPNNRSRFQNGFLSKKADGSPMPAAPTTTTFSSDSEHSPLSELELNRIPRRSPLRQMEIAAASSSEVTSSDEERSYSMDQQDVKHIRSAIKRHSMSAASSLNRSHRRRSPTASSYGTLSGSPPSENALFSAGQARRMVKSEKADDWKASVLSPRAAPVAKGVNRRTTVGDPQPSTGAAVLRNGPVRLGSASRGSLTAAQKSAWR